MKKKSKVLLTVILMFTMILSSCSFPLSFAKNNKADKKLLWSIESDNYEAVVESINEGANINKLSGSLHEKTDNGVFEQNPFRIACFLSRWSIAKYLIESGANPNDLDAEGKPILFYVVEKDNLDLCKTLLKHGVNINIKDKSGNTALDACFSISPTYTYENDVAANSMYDFLIANGANLSSQVLKNAMQDDTAAYCDYNLVQKIAKQLVSSKQEAGLSPLVESIVLGDLSKFNSLVKDQKDIDKKVLFYAAAFGDEETLQTLLDKGMNIKSTDYENDSLLEISAKTGNVNTFKYLMPKFNVNGDDGYLALESAVSNNQFETAKELIANGVKIKSGLSVTSIADVLSAACANGNLEMTKLLIENGYPSDGYIQAMQTAAQFNQVDVLSYLISTGCDVNGIFNLNTALGVASFFGSIDCVKLLASNGANINEIPDVGTPLAEACFTGQTEVVRYLLEKGADVNLQPSDPSSEQLPLLQAINSGSFDIVKLLVEHGAKVNSSIISTAESAESTNILNYLKSQK
jgi:ankyrin repeat protein